LGKGRIHWNPDKTALYLGREDQGSTIIVSTFLEKGRTIKDNILAAEAIQAKKEIGTNLRTVRMGIKEMQVPDNSSDKKWDNDFKVYLNPEKIRQALLLPA
jgi:hypothetical protein